MNIKELLAKSVENGIINSNQAKEILNLKYSDSNSGILINTLYYLGTFILFYSLMLPIGELHDINETWGILSVAFTYLVPSFLLPILLKEKGLHAFASSVSTFSILCFFLCAASLANLLLNIESQELLKDRYFNIVYICHILTFIYAVFCTYKFRYKFNSFLASGLFISSSLHLSHVYQMHNSWFPIVTTTTSLILILSSIFVDFFNSRKNDISFSIVLVGVIGFFISNNTIFNSVIKTDSFGFVIVNILFVLLGLVVSRTLLLILGFMGLFLHIYYSYISQIESFVVISVILSILSIFVIAMTFLIHKNMDSFESYMEQYLPESLLKTINRIKS